ncbi:hypothetical protein Hs30E_15770 [Lactococcus hodotermopsidis]|uniref:Uncharacterized protein n=1 Tax=Pseudolactococcus hodotermopsidis TaxID=2709157 RepID=A0A6A0BDZ6_9LACT|nr:hypothetical protein [Lactococcus hodotermopsidis]GFH43026.1 hypothetical protein Hs30E_15770 [Lactococcus hodotermopsidis]
MKIKLCWVNEIDSENPPENLKEIVWDSFRKFTKGTAEDYKFIDKLSYIDNLRKSLHDFKNLEESVEKELGGYCKYYLDEYGEMPDATDVLDTAFMAQCFDSGFMPLSELGKFGYETSKTICDIVKYVMIY